LPGGVTIPTLLGGVDVPDIVLPTVTTSSLPLPISTPSVPCITAVVTKICL
jgi:hypothetical protein